MPRYIRNTVILAKTEVTYGTDSTPTEAANAILISNVSINPLSASNVDRALVRPYMGGSEQLVGVSFVDLSFDVEISGAGTAGAAAAYGPLLLACGFAETLSVGVRAEYNLVTPAVGSVTIWYFSDGVKHVARGCRGTVQINMSVGGRPVFSFKFLGLDGGVSAATPIGADADGIQDAGSHHRANTGDLTFGATYTAARRRSPAAPVTPARAFPSTSAMTSRTPRCLVASRSISAIARPAPRLRST
jgi:hypothetical protein